MTGITGETALLAETEPLKEIANRHPFGEYARPIRCVELRRDEGGPCIVLDTADKVILRLSGREGASQNFRYILHHEFGHVYDRMDPAFQYTLEARRSLDDDRNKRVFVTDLWNTYIDGRLNRLGLFQFDQPPMTVHCFALGKILTIDSVESYIEELACRHFGMGAPLERSRELLERVWNSPHGTLTYPFFSACYEEYCKGASR